MIGDGTREGHVVPVPPRRPLWPIDRSTRKATPFHYVPTRSAALCASISISRDGDASVPWTEGSGRRVSSPAAIVEVPALEWRAETNETVSRRPSESPDRLTGRVDRLQITSPRPVRGVAGPRVRRGMRPPDHRANASVCERTKGEGTFPTLDPSSLSTLPRRACLGAL